MGEAGFYETFQKKYNTELVAVTGSSAGGINALLTAIHWLADPEEEEKLRKIDKSSNLQLLKNELEDNLFWKTWIPIGFNELLPKELDEYCKERDGHGIFSRKNFMNSSKEKEKPSETNDNGKPIIDIIKVLLKEKVYNEDTLGLGITLTRSKPKLIKIKDKIEIPLQTMRIPISVEV